MFDWKNIDYFKWFVGKGYMMKFEKLLLCVFESILQFLFSIFNWITTLEGITITVLIITLIFLILKFQYANRPYVGITKVNSQYDKDKRDLTAFIIIKNTGNIPANNVQTNMQMIRNSTVYEKMVGNSRFVLFPEQTTSGNPTYHKVEEANLTNDKFEISIEINYDLPIRFIFKVYKRKFKTTALLRYENGTGLWKNISGETI